MESEIGNPITYQPEPLQPIDARQDPPPPSPAEQESSPIEDFYYDEHPSHQAMYHHQPQHYLPEHQEKFDFASMDKMTIVLLFGAFIIGFFMGKTQTIQPMILRYN
jgi:hypothetical protein